MHIVSLLQEDMFEDSKDFNAVREIRLAADRARKKVAVHTKEDRTAKNRYRSGHSTNENTPLLRDDCSNQVV